MLTFRPKCLQVVLSRSPEPRILIIGIKDAVCANARDRDDGFCGWPTEFYLDVRLRAWREVSGEELGSRFLDFPTRKVSIMEPENMADAVSVFTGRPYEYPMAKRLHFFVSYILSKILYLWRDVKAPRIRLFAYEVVYSFCRAARRPPLPLRWLHLTQVSTVFGTFNIRAGTTDAACVSPAFERQDLDFLLARLREHLAAGQAVLFVDVGADVGTYAVSVGNCLRSLGDIRILAFEPSEASCDLLRINVKNNELADIVEPRQIGLGDGSAASAELVFDAREPGCSGLNASIVHGEMAETVKMSTLDAELGQHAPARVIALKLDVEGSEIAVLKGAAATLAAAEEVALLVEDFVDASVVSYLERTGWSFQEKVTPYNSFWILRKGNPARASAGVGDAGMAAAVQEDARKHA
jgi:FkbM family methyltransferase